MPPPFEFSTLAEACDDFIEHLDLHHIKLTSFELEQLRSIFFCGAGVAAAMIIKGESPVELLNQSSEFFHS